MDYGVGFFIVVACVIVWHIYKCLVHTNEQVVQLRQALVAQKEVVQDLYKLHEHLKHVQLREIQERLQLEARVESQENNSV